MATTVASTPSAATRVSGDSFALGVLVMLVMNLLQRVVGLVRGLGMCHFLSDVELGQWALINSYFVLAVPIAVLGLPGSFGRFVEYFRSRGQLGDYFRRVLICSTLGLALTCGLMLLLPQQFSWLLFRQSSPYGLVVWCALTLASVTLFSFVNELVSALREVRAVSLMQFVQGLVFAIVGLSVLSVNPSWTTLLPSFSIACLLAVIPGVWVVVSRYRREFEPTGALRGLPARGFWARIMPYAVALWTMNLLSNMFEVSDRYMLLHFIPDGQAAGQALVGQYHCGRILPNLLTSLAIMLSGIMLPYMSADWEAGMPQRLVARLRQVMQSMSIGFMVLAVGAMCVSPWLFHYGFRGRYDMAQAILPLSLLQAVWASLFIVAQSYMLCVERGKRLAAIMVVGLLLNLALNVWLIQHWGLFGAVAATAVANLFTLFVLIAELARSGCHLGRGTLILCLAPLAIAAGPVATSGVLVVLVLIAGRTEWLLSASDRQQIDASLLPQLQRVGLRLESLWP